MTTSAAFDQRHRGIEERWLLPQRRFGGATKKISRPFPAGLEIAFCEFQIFAAGRRLGLGDGAIGSLPNK
jgi:hypothetical protein